MTTFLERYRAGKIDDADVEDELDLEVGRWHAANSDVHLWDHLGMTYEEFRRWVTNPDTVYSMKEARA